MAVEVHIGRTIHSCLSLFRFLCVCTPNFEIVYATLCLFALSLSTVVLGSVVMVKACIDYLYRQSFVRNAVRVTSDSIVVLARYKEEVISLFQNSFFFTHSSQTQIIPDLPRSTPIY